MILYLFLLGIVSLLCYSLFINRLKGLPPGPPPLPFIGNFFQLELDLDEKLIQWKKKYGRVFTIWKPHPTVVVSDSDLLQQLLLKDGDKCADLVLQPGQHHGLIVNDNSIWKEQRRFALHSLRNAGFNNSNVQSTAVDYALETIARWKQQGADRQPVDPTMGIMVGVANIIWQQAFGRTLPYDDPLLVRVKDKANEMFVALAHPAVAANKLFPFLIYLDAFIGSPMKNLADTQKFLNEHIEKELEILKSDSNDDDEPCCYAGSFLREMKRREEAGEELGSFTHTQLVTACGDLWIAGFETTVTSLRFILHYMINYPEVQRRAQEEIDEHIGKRNIRMEDQKSLHYCTAVIQEIQRISIVGISMLPRTTSGPLTIDGHQIPVGTGILPEFSLVHKDDNVFERADYFCPERHLNEQGEFVKDPRITPFSQGKRSCLAEGLARMELFLYFTTFIQHLSFSPVSRIPPALEVQISMTRSPKPFEVIVESRD